MVVSNRTLKMQFNRYNKRYFDGRLPKNTTVELAGDCEIPKPGSLFGVAVPLPKGKWAICLDRFLTLLDGSLIKWFLLHEMIHISVLNKYRGQEFSLGDAHGLEFDAEFLRIATLGAFHDIW